MGMKEFTIPKQNIPNTKNICIEEENEPFVDIKEYSNGKILVDMQYALAGRAGAVSIAYLRKSVADRLLKAIAFLPCGYSFKILDAWRPYDVQKSLYDEYFNGLKQKHPHLSNEKLYALATNFVSYPDKEKKFSFVHSSGGAVDLTLVDSNHVDVDMGTPFDDFSASSATDALEQAFGCATQNRRILYHAMLAAGFTNYPSEWWHYDYGDVFWGAITGNPVKYASVYTMEELNIWRE